MGALIAACVRRTGSAGPRLVNNAGARHVRVEEPPDFGALRFALTLAAVMELDGEQALVPVLLGRRIVRSLIQGAEPREWLHSLLAQRCESLPLPPVVRVQDCKALRKSARAAQAIHARRGARVIPHPQSEGVRLVECSDNIPLSGELPAKSIVRTSLDLDERFMLKC